MAIIGKVQTGWAGTSGGPGLTQLYIADIALGAISQAQAQASVNAVRTFWNAIAAYLPNELTLTVSQVVDQYNPDDGELTTTITAVTAPATVAGTDTGSYSMASGMKANLQTNNIRNGRRVRGAIYIVPAASIAMNNLGVVPSAARTAVNTAGNTMITSLATANVNLLVWGRPIKAEDGTVTRNGTANFVQTVDTNEKTAVLRGRRD